MGMPSGEGSGL